MRSLANRVILYIALLFLVIGLSIVAPLGGTDAFINAGISWSLMMMFEIGYCFNRCHVYQEIAAKIARRHVAAIDRVIDQEGVSDHERLIVLRAVFMDYIRGEK